MTKLIMIRKIGSNLLEAIVALSNHTHTLKR